MVMSVLTEFVQPQSLVDGLVRRLEAAIMTGEFPPGARLSEAALSVRLGVSRGPIREAIRQLEGRKLLVRETNFGTRVATVSLKDVEELLVVREALEGVACRLATEQMTDAEIQDLAAAQSGPVAEQPSAQDLLDLYGETRPSDFHVRIAECSGNSRLKELLFGEPFSLLRIYRYRSGRRPGRLAEGRAEHRAILAAMADRDGVKAEMLMREHLQHSHAAILAALKEAAPPE